MAYLRFHHRLQQQLLLTDNRWEFTIRNLPNTTECDQAGYIKSCKLTANSSQQCIDLSYSTIDINRAISKRPLSTFVHVTCSDFRLQTEDGKQATFKESSEYLARFFKHGLVLNGIKYSFYGHSNSQLKSKSCFLMAGSQDYVDREVERLGDFTTMKSVAKKTKRIGLLFSTAHTVIDVHPDRCKDIVDIERDDYIFTDGCGRIAEGLARLLTQKKPILFRNKRYHPSVFQIRYRGYKGVVTVEPKLSASTWLELRKSMRKFSGGDDHSFAVVAYSKPYTYGYLNDEIVLLLHALGIQQDILEKKQSEHIEFLEAARRNARSAFSFLTSINCTELAEKCLLEGIETVEKQLHKLISQEESKMLNKRGETRCRILVPKSRLLFGVCDPYEILEEGQCYVKPTSSEDGVPYPLTGTYVLVARNPCLHPGDLQKLRVVNKPELAHLVDCIVFSTKGKRPSADMMSGGDLDGDTFFVCWDSDLVSTEISQPAEYPGGREPVQFHAITSFDRIDYFCRASSMQLGQVKNLFLRWARVKGPLSSECQELNRLFSQCVDANRIKIPERLKDSPQEQATLKSFILDALHDAAERCIKARAKPAEVDSIDSEDTLLGILAEPSNLSQFELAQLTLRWCQLNHVRFGDYWQYFDPTRLSSEERAWFLSHLPAEPNIAEFVTNDLMHSNIVSPTELSSVGLRNPNIRWRCVFKSSSDRLANLLDVLYRTFPFFTRKLLILGAHERLSVALYLPKLMNPTDDYPLNICGRLFAFPHDKDPTMTSRIIKPTKYNTLVYYDHNRFDLFEGKRGNTFISLKKAPNDRSRYQNLKGKGHQARAREQTIRDGTNHEWQTSIALQKFGNDIQKHIRTLLQEGLSSAELYVISNTDTRSFRGLDLWLEQIDTEKMHQNFANEEIENPEVMSLSGIVWESETETVRRIAKDQRFNFLEVASPDDVARVLDLAWLTSSQQLAGRVVSHWAKLLKEGHQSANSLDITARLIDSLFRMPELVIYFIRLCPWTALHPDLREQLMSEMPRFLEALVLSANRMGQLAASSMTTLLQETTILPISELKAIIESVALTASSTETALDILIGSLEPMTSRVLLNTPRNSQYVMTRLSAIAVDHIEEAIDIIKASKSGAYKWRFAHPLMQGDQGLMLKSDYRTDAPKVTYLAAGDHVRFICKEPPTNLLLTEPATFEALVDKYETGQVTFRCFRHPPSWYQQCPWDLKKCGSFVTAQTMIDAVMKLMTEKESCCEAFTSLFPSRSKATTPRYLAKPRFDLTSLNESQRNAVIQALSGPVTCIWGPPGTGKTHTIVSIIHEILTDDTEKRLLVTAPTHNAVDHLMRQYLKSASQYESSVITNAIRVSTDLRKVSPDLQKHTCDALLGKDLNFNPNARRKAQQQITRARLIFTTCIGAGLGLLRNEHFANVIIDEASLQTEPASLVPLIKGASRIVLVGDHVQLRATVRPNAQVLGFDVSLFERLWVESSETSPKPNKNVNPVRRAMLDTQYRMHPTLCAFPSTTFYESKLKSAAHCKSIALPKSAFSWPRSTRAVFIQVDAPEDLGQKSKSNAGQARVCAEVIRLLRSPPPSSSTPSPANANTSPSPPLPSAENTNSATIAVLTPYTRQETTLQSLLPAEKISTIDRFQGQEADIVVYVTVRCNVHCDLGFLSDLRRLNVAVTRAKAALVVVGDRGTLVGMDRGSGSMNGNAMGGLVESQEVREEEEFFRVWRRLIGGMATVTASIDGESGEVLFEGGGGGKGSSGRE